jgi:hypothetical protein
MAAVVVRATIDEKGKTVTFAGNEGDPTFRVKVGDAITWQLEGVPEGSRAQVRFEPLLKAAGTPLLEHGHLVEGNRETINAAVGKDAPDGDYSYEIELLSAQGTPTKLACLWTTGGRTRMAGGQKSGGPR